MGDAVSFDLSTVFQAVADAIPDSELLVWRDRRFTYAQTTARVDGVANYLTSVGLGCHTERDGLAGHDSGQDHLGLYLRNGNEYLESMIAAYRARVAPFNVSYRYVEEELVYLLSRLEGDRPGLQRGVRPARRGDPRPAARTCGCSSRSPTSPATRCCPERSTTSRSSAPPAPEQGMPDTDRRRSLRSLHRRHHRNAQGRAVATARHLHLRDGWSPVRQRHGADLLRRDRRAGQRPRRARCRF